MPDYYNYQYDRTIDGEPEFKINNPDRTVVIESEHAATIALVTDENAKALFEEIFPSQTVPKTLHEELMEGASFKDSIYDIFMDGPICTVRTTRQLTEEEISELDTFVEDHKNNT